MSPLVTVPFGVRSSKSHVDNCIDWLHNKHTVDSPAGLTTKRLNNLLHRSYKVPCELYGERCLIHIAKSSNGSQNLHRSYKVPCELYGARCLIHIAKSSNGSQNDLKSAL
ncbi:unnamed protein product [Clavelina lepadiformis]|uniref:Uncharacterized protein n=1 Tax=Clavelina lepadiformis TaxID=159417 RepID=A0ABP0G7R8_CLALP